MPQKPTTKSISFEEIKEIDEKYSGVLPHLFMRIRTLQQKLVIERIDRKRLEQELEYERNENKKLLNLLLSKQ